MLDHDELVALVRARHHPLVGRHLRRSPSSPTANEARAEDRSASSRSERRRRPPPCPDPPPPLAAMPHCCCCRCLPLHTFRYIPPPLARLVLVELVGSLLSHRLQRVGLSAASSVDRIALTPAGDFIVPGGGPLVGGPNCPPTCQ